MNLLDAFKQYIRDAMPGGALNPEVTKQGLLDTAAIATTPVPILGDAIGLAADVKRLKDNPQERTPMNIGLSALGVLPFVPGLVGVTKASKAMDALRPPQADALETARKNAVTMLGLPPNNTPMDRAKALGYVDDVNGAMYRGSHQAPTSADDIGAPLHRLDAVYPADIYSSKAAHYYGDGAEPARDAALVRRLQAHKANPDSPSWADRAVPKGAPDFLQHGDWVTTEKQYAINHGEAVLNGDYKIIASRVPAKTLFTDGSSIYEFGYDVSQRFADGPASIPIVRSTNPKHDRCAPSISFFLP